MSAFLFSAGQNCPGKQFFRRSSCPLPRSGTYRALKASHDPLKRLIVALRDAVSGVGNEQCCYPGILKKPESGARVPASDFRGDWTTSIAAQNMVRCQISPVAFSGALLGAQTILSATDPKPLASTIVRDDESQLVSRRRRATPRHSKSWLTATNARFSAWE